MVNRSVTKIVAQPIDAVFAVLQDLSTYPDWMGLVTAVEPDGDTGGLFVTISGRLGPFSRSKKLRMVRTSFDDAADKHVRFERQETLPGEFSDWIMEASVNTVDDSNTEVTVELIYDGKLWTGGLESVLDSQIEKSVGRLTEYVEQS